MSALTPCCDDVRVVESSRFLERFALDRRMRHFALRAAAALVLAAVVAIASWGQYRQLGSERALTPPDSAR